MKKIINYIFVFIGILCLPIGYVVAGNNSIRTSQSTGLLCRRCGGTTAVTCVVISGSESVNKGEKANVPLFGGNPNLNLLQRDLNTKKLTYPIINSVEVF